MVHFPDNEPARIEMVDIKCRTLPKPQDGTRPIYRKNNDKGISEKESLLYRVVLVKS